MTCYAYCCSPKQSTCSDYIVRFLEFVEAQSGSGSKPVPERDSSPT